MRFVAWPGGLGLSATRPCACALLIQRQVCSGLRPSECCQGRNAKFKVMSLIAWPRVFGFSATRPCACAFANVRFVAGFAHVSAVKDAVFNVMCLVAWPRVFGLSATQGHVLVLHETSGV